ncbi:nucleoside:proton symporter [Acetobacteraceae bacterium H6797]|nr:nucleoside:proton symporter [Acetobacteraceae bacterium H6797]
MVQLQSGIGLLALAVLCWLLGGAQRPIPWRAVIAGLGLQFILAVVMLYLPPVRAALAWMTKAVDALVRATEAGTSLVFGFLGGAPLPYVETVPGGSYVLFFKSLPLILVVGALSALLYHWRVLPLIVRGLSKILRAAFGISGACGFSVAANVFVGMVEAPLMIRAWLGRLTRSELFVVMTAGLAGIAGNMLVVYATFIGSVVPDAAGQLLTASLISAPAAIMAAMLMLPGPPPREDADTEAPALYDSSMDAIVRGTAEGLTLLLGIMAALIVFVALVALANEILSPTGHKLQEIAGWIFWPIALAMGIPVEQAGTAAQLLGVKTVINEFIAYLQLAGEAGKGLDARSKLIITYALCSFANFGSVGIMVAGMTAMCPERRTEIVRLGLPALVAGTLAACMTGAVVGVLTPG